MGCSGNINLPDVDCVMNHPTSPQGLLLSSACKWDNEKCAWKGGGEGTCKRLGKDKERTAI